MPRDCDASIIIRAYNEARWLPEVFAALNSQIGGLCYEVVLVDSGSTDNTVEIARRCGARVVFIRKEEFSFGRSLNIGCEAAHGKALVILSAHCIPVGERWLEALVAPLLDGTCSYTYGRQLPHALSKYSEARLFEKFFPSTSSVPAPGIFCNNANAALSREVWRENRFDEALTGLEDMDLAKRLVARGHRLGYVAEAPVIHIHDETWDRVRIRYEREAIALQHILPEVHLSLFDAVRYWVRGVTYDFGVARRERVLFAKWREIILFRAMQYWGSYRGNAPHRQSSRSRKEEYFYPRPDPAAAGSDKVAAPKKERSAVRVSA